MDPISQEIIEAFLDGKITGHGIPQELQHVAQLMQKAQLPATKAELEGEHFAVQAFQTANGSALHPGGKSKVLSKLLSTKAATAAVAVALTGGGAAAATGLIPVSFHHGIPTLGTQVTTTSTTSSASTTSTTVLDSTSTTQAGPTSTSSTLIPNENQGMASGHSLFGLCTAYAHITTSGTTQDATNTSTSVTSLSSTSSTVAALSSTAFSQLQALATAQNMTVAQLCATTSNPGQAHAQTAKQNAPGFVNKAKQTIQSVTSTTIPSTSTTSAPVPQTTPSGNTIPSQSQAAGATNGHG